MGSKGGPSADKFKDLIKMDLYALLEIPSTALTKEVRSAYRKKALAVHPDKNRNNPKAAEQFHLLSDVLALLEDENARKAYDKVYEGRKQKAVRDSAMDAKRKKLKEELEERERQALEKHEKKQQQKDQEDDQRQAEANLLQEMRRIEKQMQATLEREEAEMRRKFQEEEEARKKQICLTPTFKIKWNAKFPHQNAYTEEKVRQELSKFGNLKTLILSRRPGAGVVEFGNMADALKAHAESEKGRLGRGDNPLLLEWLEGRPTAEAAPPEENIPDRVTLENMEANILQQMMSAGKAVKRSST